MATSPINIEINIVEKKWSEENRFIKRDIKSVLKKIIPQTNLNKFLIKNVKLEISILLTNDQQIRQLNKDYRRKNKATDVLSFPLINPIQFQKDNIDNFADEVRACFELSLGDIILSYETIKKEAMSQNKTFQNHLAHLLIHSLLHLIGYDHIKKKDAKIMETLEVELLKKLAIDNPYNI